MIQERGELAIDRVEGEKNDCDGLTSENMTGERTGSFSGSGVKVVGAGRRGQSMNEKWSGK